MLRINDEEEIIRLLNNGFGTELLSFELNLPKEQIEICKKRLELRKNSRESIKNGSMPFAIENLRRFINGAESSLVEQAILVKLIAYADKVSTSDEELQEIYRKFKEQTSGLSIDEILDELKVQIPKRKGSNKRKKEIIDAKSSDEQETKDNIDEGIEQKDYSLIIEKYKKRIEANPQKSQNTRNLLAFAYFKSGRIDEARDELMELIDANNSYLAYRQLIHLETNQGNYEDAKLWAYEVLDRFPESIEIREQLILIARKEKKPEDVISLLNEILQISPGSERHKDKLERMSERQKER